MQSALDLWEGFLPANSIIMSRPIAIAESSPHRLYFEIAEPLSAEAEAVFRKMTTALGLTPEEAIYGPPLAGGALFTVRLTGGPGTGESHSDRLTTHSLSEMIARPELKRETWNHLKTVALKLGLKIK